MEVKVEVVSSSDPANTVGGEVTEDGIGGVDVSEGTVPASIDTVVRSVSGDILMEDDGLKTDRVIGVNDGPTPSQTWVVSKGTGHG